MILECVDRLRRITWKAADMIESVFSVVQGTSMELASKGRQGIRLWLVIFISAGNIDFGYHDRHEQFLTFSILQVKVILQLFLRYYERSESLDNLRTCLVPSLALNPTTNRLLIDINIVRLSSLKRGYCASSDLCVCLRGLQFAPRQVSRSSVTFRSAPSSLCLDQFQKGTFNHPLSFSPCNDQHILVVPAHQRNFLFTACVQLVQAAEDMAKVNDRATRAIDLVEDVIAEKLERVSFTRLRPCADRTRRCRGRRMWLVWMMWLACMVPWVMLRMMLTMGCMCRTVWWLKTVLM